MSVGVDSKAPTGGRLAILTVTAFGVVFGDIGTSPLYAIRECFHGSHAVPVTSGNVLGVLSLVFWSLVLVISIKYLAVVMRADNRGEGGILALMALVHPSRPDRRGRPRRVVLMLGLFGAALLYGDGMITPAISVLGAVEGLQVATPVFQPYVIPITITILVCLFLFQRHGTARVGAVFGPVTLVWFIVLALLGMSQIVRQPHVLAAINPLYAVEFFARSSWHGFAILGTVFLVVTGGEALYADMGHFGLRPIRLGWFAAVLPALLLNYFGQGALLLADATAAVNPFYRMAPGWGLYPLIVLATAATVIASQAVISGAFSLTRQAIQLGYSPRARIEHTSSDEIGQIYLPAVNWALMLSTVSLVLGFGSSSALAAAYGVAVTSTMVITTLLLYVVMRERWGWSRLAAGPLSAGFLAIDLAFFGANIIKVPHGGWFPLVVAGGIFTLMVTWKRGREILAERLPEKALPLPMVLADFAQDPPRRVPGTAVFMTGDPDGTPIALLHNLTHNKVLHERVIIVSVLTDQTPRVPSPDRVAVEDLGHGFYRVTARYGFMEDPDIPRILERCREFGLDVCVEDATFFLGRETLLATDRPGMAIWREKLFAFMSRNALRATAYFRIPAERVFEVGAQVEL